MIKKALPKTFEEKPDPLVSVVLPVYNGAKYVREAVHSILAQSFSNYELIIINDGSTDGTLEILEELRRQDSRIVFISRENRGLVDSLNEGISLARAKWIARMDQDDIALPQRFERQLYWLEQTGADICGSWVKFFGSSDHRVLKHPQSEEAIKMELLFGSPFAHPTVMMRANLAKQLRYDKAWEKCEDYDMWERAARAGWRMTNVPEILLLYRQHEAQISTSASSDQRKRAKQVQVRYWTALSDSMALKAEWIDEIMKLREPTPARINMDSLDSAFAVLLQQSQGEARATVFEHATRLYFRAAADCPDVVARWATLNRRYGTRFALWTKLELWIVSVLRIRANSRMFGRLKKLYLYVLGSS